MGTASLFNANTPQQTCQPKDTETFPHGHHVCCRLTLCFHVNTQDKYFVDIPVTWENLVCVR